MEKFKKDILNRLDELEDYGAKADCLETIEVTLAAIGDYENKKAVKEFLDEQWDKNNEMWHLEHG